MRWRHDDDGGAASQLKEKSDEKEVLAVSRLVDVT